MKQMGNKLELIEKTLARGVENIYPSKEMLRKALLGGKKLAFYLGADPTGPHLHLGTATNLLLLKRLQELGHRIIFLIGDMTARIGDPTDKLSPRQPLTEKQVQENLKTFKSQVGKVISFTGKNPATIKFNSTWYRKMGFADILDLASRITVQQMIARDMFQERLKSGKPIGVHEFLYPLMQGYDSVAMNVDGEIGGTDQTFNMLVGRDLMRALKGKEKFVITTKLLVDPKTGKKLMNKSEGGMINLDDGPEDMFGKVMAIDDENMTLIADFSTDMTESRLLKLKSDLSNKRNPRDIKMEIAFEVVSLYHSPALAKKAKEAFINTFSKREVPAEMPSITLPQKKMRLTEFLLKAGVPSKSEARRLLQQGAIQVNQETVPADDEMIFASGDIVKIGKKRFVKIR